MCVSVCVGLCPNFIFYFLLSSCTLWFSCLSYSPSCVFLWLLHINTGKTFSITFWSISEFHSGDTLLFIYSTSSPLPWTWSFIITYNKLVCLTSCTWAAINVSSILEVELLDQRLTTSVIFFILLDYLSRAQPLCQRFLRSLVLI